MNLITTLRQSGQDHEFYPTTNEIIDALTRDFLKLSGVMQRREGRLWKADSWLDIGAGHGKVLGAVKSALEAAGRDAPRLYAIEKSELLIRLLEPSVLVIGTVFEEQTLHAKNIDVTFSNPPYSVFAPWAAKIIRETNSKYIYLVLPVRWQENQEIQDALDYRGFTAKVVGEFDFLNSEDRKARAKVHLIRIVGLLGTDTRDSFSRFFSEAFPGLEEKFARQEEFKGFTEDAQKNPRFSGGLVPGECLPKRLVRLYMAEMEHLRRTYTAMIDIEASVFHLLKVSLKDLREKLRFKLTETRSLYWNELFDHCDKLTDRLTKSSRTSLLEQLRAHSEVDFTYTNILAVLIWAIKNANQYLESQFIATYEKMVEKANVVLYKSNTRVFVEDRHRYCSDRNARSNSHFGLDYRIVCYRVGGCNTSPYDWEKGLEKRAASFLGDLLTIARNLGFLTETAPPMLTVWANRWIPGKAYGFYGSKNDREYTLIEVRAFKNGNLHLRFDKAFMLAMNVEYGRLKGWLKSPAEAAAETGEAEAAALFGSHHYIPLESPTLLLEAS